MKRTVSVLAAIGLTVSLAACGANKKDTAAAPSKSAAKQGGTLYILPDAQKQSFDPAKSQGLAITSLALVHRRLTTWDVQEGKPTTVVPDLATDTGRASDGGKTWTFTLKANVKFSDGTPITSADVKHGVERSFAPAFSGGLGYHKTLLEGGPDFRGPFEGKNLSSVETPDPKTIVFRLSRPYGDWPWVASNPAFSPVPKGKGAEANYGENPAASGPYQVAKYQPGVEMRLKRNTHWSKETDKIRGGLPDEVVFQLGQQASVTSKRLIEDNGDDRFAFGASFVSPAQLAQIQGNPGAKSRLVTSKTGAVAYLAINTQRIKDPKVRQAFQYAVDKTTYQVATAGSPALAGDIATTLITQGINGRQQYDLYPAPPVGDPAKAKALLAEAGQAGGLDNLNLVVSTSNNFPEKAQAIQAALARANIKVTIKTLDGEAYTAATTGPNADYDLALSSWQPDFPSPNANLQPLFSSSEIGKGGYNISRYSNPEVDKLITEAQSTVDPNEAGKKWAAIDKLILQDSPVVPLIYTRNSFLRGSKVADFFIADFPAYPNYLKAGISQ
ncbi:ABC transporter substrate-binding protein [Longispora albida]|uniref:ABC transporter substrate-binding protein n=1 Tax=Longispora albida TaxID=203523 RepID=UPI0003A47F6E|nr:ABC transporter substrate-binding protein [Longispora albida]